MNPSGENASDSGATCRFEKPAVEPSAELGILLVHGIGGHGEGETLTAFGEPLLDWMRRWLRGAGGNRQRGTLTVAEARLKAGDSPAYAVAEVRMGAATGEPESSPKVAPDERWLICEGWWGGAVQAPASWALLAWLWSRGPLLVYWHYYLLGVARGYSEKDPRILLLIVPAFLLASFCQLAVTLAMVLWFIPIGPWRKAVVAVVRKLTLTLGDSFVLLEQEIQRAALVERVRRSLAWLAERTERVVVIAHSQGGAIAHEALRIDAPEKVERFVSVGSGLEKLRFLEEVRGRRQGLVSSALVLPACLATLGMILAARRPESPGWQEALAWVFALGVLAVLTALYMSLQAYRQDFEAAADALKPPAALGKMQWLDLFATRDVVPMGKGSLLREASFLKRKPVSNRASHFRDHTSYFTNTGDCLHRIWALVAGSSNLPLFGEQDLLRLERFARHHRRSVRRVSFSRRCVVLAALILGVLLRGELVSFGQSVLAGFEGSPFQDWLKPIQAVAAGCAWLVDQWWRPGVATPALLTQSFFGLALLLGGLALWWAAFQSIWRWRSKSRWRAAARGADLPQTTGRRLARGVGLGLFAIVGSFPLLVAVLLYFRPALFTFEALARLLAGSASLVTLLLAFYFAGAGPWVDSGLRVDRSTTPATRVFSALGTVLLPGILLWAARALWPTALPAAVEDTLRMLVALTFSLAWQGYALWQLRQQLGRWMTWLVALLPAATAVGLSDGQPALAGILYAAVTSLLLAGAFLWHHRQELPKIAGEVWALLRARGVGT